MSLDRLAELIAAYLHATGREATAANIAEAEALVLARVRS